MHVLQTPNFIARQLSNPRGFRGRLMAFLMNRTNARMNEFAVRQLDLTASDRVLEIGFGGGLTLPILIEQACFVCAVHRSADMVKRAKARYAEAVNADRAVFVEGSIEALPCESALLQKICAVNTVYWGTPWNVIVATRGMLACAEQLASLRQGENP